MKMMVIGYSGSGKSTLAKKLATYYKLPLLYMDRLQFEAGWIERDPDLRNQDLMTFMDTHDTWVIDGNYAHAHFDKRVHDATHIYILDYPMLFCLKQVIKRYRIYKYKNRESISDGCHEKLDFEFLKWVIYKGRSKKRRKSYITLEKRYPNKVKRFKNQKQLNHYLESIGI